jgi:DNA invertase Pin-like site-specific DNA recombinase
MVVPALIPAVGYARRSTDKQEASIPDQVKAVERYAREKGYRIIRWYIDDAISGDDTRNRKDFLRMVADAPHGDFRAILCWDEKRFGRFDSIEYGHYVYPLREAGIHLATVLDGPIDWTQATGRIVANVKQEAAYDDLVKLSAGVCRGHETAFQNGGWVGGKPYAYVLVGKKYNKRLEVEDPGKAKVVQRIFREFTQDRHPMTGIADRLNRDGIIAPNGTVGGWTNHAIATILGNVAYTGDFAGRRWSFGKYHTVKDGMPVKGGKRCRRPEEEWIVRRDWHEAIIDRETFARAQERLDGNRKKREPDEGKQKRGWTCHYPAGRSPYFMTGFLLCGRCGCPLHGVNDHGTRFYECSNRDSNGNDACAGTTVRQDIVLRSLAAYLDDWLVSDGVSIGEAAFFGALPGSLDDLPKSFRRAFADIKKLLLAPATPKRHRDRLEKQLAKLKATVAKARGNLVHLDTEFIPDGQAEIRKNQEQVEQLEKALKDSKPTPEKDLNQEVLAAVWTLGGVASCVRQLAKPGEWLCREVDGETVWHRRYNGFDYHHGHSRNAPQNLRRFLSQTAGITVHTERKGQGSGIRHRFAYGEIALKPGLVREAKELRDQGFTDVHALRGGFDAWLTIGGPVEPK